MDDGSRTMCLDAEEVRILEHREAVDLGIPHFKAHYSIFAPAVFVSVLYLAFWAFLFFTGSSSGWVAQLFIASLAIVLPLLFAAAFLRYQTVRAQVFDEVLIYHPGWPKDAARHLKVADITSVNLRKDAIDKIFKSGSLMIVCQDGETVELERLAGAEALMSILEEKFFDQV